jgi:hypothetical protein
LAPGGGLFASGGTVYFAAFMSVANSASSFAVNAALAEEARIAHEHWDAK